jgi:hypothetical protein
MGMNMLGPQGLPRNPRRDREKHEREVQQKEVVRQARKLPSYNGRWSIAWAQVAGCLLMAVFFAGVLLFLALLLWHVHE